MAEHIASADVVLELTLRDRLDLFLNLEMGYHLIFTAVKNFTEDTAERPDVGRHWIMLGVTHEHFWRSIVLCADVNRHVAYITFHEFSHVVRDAPLDIGTAQTRH